MTPVANLLNPAVIDLKEIHVALRPDLITYGIQIRKTTEGKEAIMMDKRFYVTHLDYDPIIEELDATAIIKGLK